MRTGFVKNKRIISLVKSVKKTRFYVLAASLFFIVIGMIIIGILKFHAPQPTYPVSRHIQYAFTLQNRTNRAIKNAEFWTYAPVKQTATQRCTRFESSHPHQLIMDDLGNQILHFTFNDFPPYANKIITINAYLSVSDAANPIAVPDFKIFLRPEKYIECDDACLCSAAQKLKASKTLKTTETIFHWVANNLRYTGYIKNDRGALYALKTKEGDCTEFMHLFVALCRANKIPARCIGGYVRRENATLKPADYHNWAEFYQDGAWRIADPQNRVFMKNQADYIATRIIEYSPDDAIPQFNRFRVKGNGLKVRMN
jgi:hypothetical protein